MPVVVLAAACVALVLAQDVAPGLAWYHSGSYAALLLALMAAQWWALRRFAKFALLACGASVIGFAGLAACLLGPDTQTIVRGPGESVPLSEPAGILQFPLSRSPAAPVLHRAGKGELGIDLAGNKRVLAAYVLWTRQRSAAYIEAFDARGRRLTLTQPANTSFLSPVLLFGQTTQIAGRQLPVDSFAVPAAHRSVKAILFLPDDVAQMQRLSGDRRAGILFAVEDEAGRLLPGAIALARDGSTVSVGGVRLRPKIGTFPAVVIASAPYLPLLVLGALLCVAGAVTLKNPFRLKSGSSRSLP